MTTEQKLEAALERNKHLKKLIISYFNNENLMLKASTGATKSQFIKQKESDKKKIMAVINGLVENESLF